LGALAGAFRNTGVAPGEPSRISHNRESLSMLAMTFAPFFGFDAKILAVRGRLIQLEDLKEGSSFSIA
jgi:hypothetical protein